MTTPYIGTKFTVSHCDGADESFDEALRHVPQKKQRSLKNWSALVVKRLGEGMRLADVVTEADLPDGASFYAARNLPIRMYFWYSKAHSRQVYISHYKFKNYQKLSKSDIDKVTENWKLYEGI